MRKLLAIITIAILILSCSNKEKNVKQKVEKTYSEIESKKIKRNHEILNVILDRWAPLSNTILSRRNRDSIFLNEIVLVPKSITDLSYDTIDNGFSIKPYTFSLSEPPLFQTQRDTILKQIRNATSTIWNSGLIFSTIRIDHSLTEKKVSFPGELHDKYSFLVISEPIEFSKDVFFVTGQLYTKKILLDNLYIVEKVGAKWKVIDVESAIIKLNISPTKTILNKNGSTREETTLSAIFEGYLNEK